MCRPADRDDGLQHPSKRRRVDPLTLAISDGAGGLVVVAARDDTFPVGNDGIVDEHVHMILGGEQRANVAALTQSTAGPCA